MINEGDKVPVPVLAVQLLVGEPPAQVRFDQPGPTRVLDVLDEVLHRLGGLGCEERHHDGHREVDEHPDGAEAGVDAWLSRRRRPLPYGRGAWPGQANSSWGVGDGRIRGVPALGADGSRWCVGRARGRVVDLLRCGARPGRGAGPVAPAGDRPGGSAELAAVGLGVWQLVHLYSLVGIEGWMPGPGPVLTVGAGVLALAAVRSLLHEVG